MLQAADYESFSEDPELALAEAIELLLERGRVQSSYSGLNDEEGYSYYLSVWEEAAAILSGICEELDMAHAIDCEIHGARSEWVDGFLRSLRRYHSKISMRKRISKFNKHSLDFSAVELDQDHRDKIRDHTRKIRGIISQIDIGPDLRQSLLNKLNVFEAELDRERTRWESLFSLFRSMTKAVGDGAENLEPAVKQTERIIGAMHGQQENQIEKESENKSLPAPDDLDEDIPF